MKLRKGFVTHDTDGTQILVSANNEFNGLIRSNKTAAFIVNCLKEETTADEIVEKMLEKYDAPKDVIEKDVAKAIEILKSINAIE